MLIHYDRSKPIVCTQFQHVPHQRVFIFIFVNTHVVGRIEQRGLRPPFGLRTHSASELHIRSRLPNVVALLARETLSTQQKIVSVKTCLFAQHVRVHENVVCRFSVTRCANWLLLHVRGNRFRDVGRNHMVTKLNSLGSLLSLFLQVLCLLWLRDGFLWELSFQCCNLMIRFYYSEILLSRSISKLYFNIKSSLYCIQYLSEMSLHQLRCSWQLCSASICVVEKIRWSEYSFIGWTRNNHLYKQMFTISVTAA